jgi:hypothetical protein
MFTVVSIYVLPTFPRGEQKLRHPATWCLLTLLLGLFFCLQFALSVGELPGLISLWYYLPATYQRWLALFGYEQGTLDWTFVTLLAFVLQIPAILRPPRRLRNAGAGYSAVESASVAARKKRTQHQSIEVAAGDFLDSVVSVMVLLSDKIVLSDKIILIFIFVTGTLTADAPSLGFLLFSLYLLFDGTYDVTDPTSPCNSNRRCSGWSWPPLRVSSGPSRPLPKERLKQPSTALKLASQYGTSSCITAYLAQGRAMEHNNSSKKQPKCNAQD